jgi:hypothetical protein
MGRDTLGHYLGELPGLIWEVLRLANENRLSVQSDLARSYAPEVALAASLGLISNVDTDYSKYMRSWRITAAGLYALEHRSEICGKQSSGRTSRRPASS